MRHDPHVSGVSFLAISRNFCDAELFNHSGVGEQVPGDLGDPKLRFTRGKRQGQQQLVGIARAIISKPKLLLADEPTGNLHTTQGEMIMETLKELNKEGMTIIQVTHNERFAGYGKRIIRLEDGNIRSNNIIL